MLGREGDPGIMYLTTMELYRRLEARQEEKRFEVLISYLEVRLLLLWSLSSLILTATCGEGDGEEGGRKWIMVQVEPRRCNCSEGETA
jgi:hypothetical protein